jgi:hypothetical protein
MADFIFYRQAGPRERISCAKEWERLRAHAMTIRDEYDDEMERHVMNEEEYSDNSAMEDKYADYYYFKLAKTFFTRMRSLPPLSMVMDYVFAYPAEAATSEFLRVL